MERPYQYARGPWISAWQMIDGEWTYQWWDDVDSYVIGEPPTRHKVFTSVHGLLPAILSDAARAGLLPDVTDAE